MLTSEYQLPDTARFQQNEQAAAATLLQRLPVKAARSTQAEAATVENGSYPLFTNPQPDNVCEKTGHKCDRHNYLLQVARMRNF
jgi:hypothetical protein